MEREQRERNERLARLEELNRRAEAAHPTPGARPETNPVLAFLLIVLIVAASLLAIDRTSPSPDYSAGAPPVAQAPAPPLAQAPR